MFLIFKIISVAQHKLSLKITSPIKHFATIPCTFQTKNWSLIATRYSSCCCSCCCWGDLFKKA